MSNNVLFGSYRNTHTPLHKLDARIKVLCLFLVTIAVFAVRQPWALAVLAAGVLACAYAAKITLPQLAGAIKPALFILLISLLCNMFVLDGTADITLIGTFGISFVGLARGSFAIGRIFVLVALALVLTSTTSSTQLADAFTSLLAPLGKLGLPVGDIAMTISVALRFIPLTAEELVRIRDAQRVRGVNFDEGKITERLGKWLSVLTPLVVALFRNSDDLAKAMRERCYKSFGRTRFAKKLTPTDIAALIVVSAVCVVVCLV